MVEKYLIEKGIKTCNKGFNYIVKAIELIRNNNKYKNFVTKELYPEIGKYYQVSGASVQVAISRVIRNAKIKLTSLEFITIAEIETR